MKKIISLLFIIPLLIGCTENLVTGRKQLDLVSETELQTMATQEYQLITTIKGLPLS